MTCSLDLGQILMHELDDDSAFADTGCHPLYRAVPHVANDKNTGNVRLQQPWIAVERPAFGSLSIFKQIGARQNEAALVTFDQAIEPFRAGLRADENEQAAGRHLLDFSGHRTLNR